MREGNLKLDLQTIDWIQTAASYINDFGEIHIKIHEGRITKVIADKKTEIRKPLTIMQEIP